MVQPDMNGDKHNHEPNCCNYASNCLRSYLLDLIVYTYVDIHSK